MLYILAVKICELIRISQLNSKTLLYQDIWYLLSNQVTTIGIHGKYFVKNTSTSTGRPGGCQWRAYCQRKAKGTNCDTGEERYGGN